MDEKVDPYPLIWADATMRPHPPSKTRLSPKRRNQWRGWVTHIRIDENPVIRRHDLCFDKTCQENRLAICAVAGWEKRFVMTRPWQDVTL